jgi:hypothetical protein
MVQFATRRHGVGAVDAQARPAGQRLDKEEKAQGLKPSSLLTLNGPTKSRALIQNMSFSAAL